MDKIETAEIEWRAFKTRQLPLARLFAETGIAIHMGGIVGEQYPNAPKVFKGKHFAHMMGPNEGLLTLAAISIGCKERWIQRKKSGLHYDLTGSILTKALNLCSNKDTYEHT